MKSNSLARAIVLISAVALTFMSLVSCGTRERGNRVACLSNLKMLYMTLNQYEMEYGSFPFVPGKHTTEAGGDNHVINLLLIRRTVAGDMPALYICPSDEGAVAGPDKGAENIQPSDFTTENNSYAYFMGDVASPGKMRPTDGLISDGYRSSNGSNIADVTDDGWSHAGLGNWVTADGSAKQVEAGNWPDLVQGNPNAKGDWKSFIID